MYNPHWRHINNRKTTASNKNISSKIYKMILSPTKKTITDIQTEYQSGVSTHAGIATGVHGVGISTVESTSGSQLKVDTHAALTTGIHGLSSLAPIASPTFTGTVTLPVTLTGVLRADTGIVSIDSDITNLVDNLSYTQLADGIDGNLITWDANGAPAVVATGNAGQVLTSAGAGAVPTFQTISAGWTTITKAVADSPFTAAADNIILCNAVGGNMTINLPAAASNTNKVYAIKKIDASVYTVAIDGNASETIDGVITQILSITLESLIIQSDGANWFVLADIRATSVVSGVSWNESADTYARTDSLAGQSMGITLSDALLPIHARMQRCVINDGGVLQYYLDPTDSTKKADGSASVLTGADGQVMVEIPAFYYVHNYTGTTHTWKISLSQQTGFVLHPAFTKNGVSVTHRYIGAYEGSMWDASASAMVASGDITANMYAAGDKLCSLSGQYPKTNETRAEFRGMAASRGTGWRQQDFDLISAIQLLYIIEYANFNSQTMIGMGRTELIGSWTADSYIGQCGKSNSKGNGTFSVGGDTNDSYMTYRGIENFFGNVWKFVDGININDHVPYVSNTDSQFADDTATNYTSLSVTLGASDGYQATLSNISRGFLPATVGGSSSTKVPDYYNQAAGWRVAFLGGVANISANAGAFYLRALNASSYIFVNVGGRLAF
jgi:hypothetical protein